MIKYDVTIHIKNAPDVGHYHYHALDKIEIEPSNGASGAFSNADLNLIKDDPIINLNIAQATDGVNTNYTQDGKEYAQAERVAKALGIWTGRVVVRKPIGGKDYFYDLDKIREVGQWDVSKLNPIADNTTSLNNISLPSVNGTVNSNIRKSSKNNAKFSINEPKLSDIANLKPADANTNYRGIANEETLQKAQNIVLHTPLTSEYAKLDEARMRSKAFKFRG